MNDPGVILDRCFDLFVERLLHLPDFELPRQRIKQVGEVASDFELFSVSIPPSGIYPGMPGQASRGYSASAGGFVGYAMNIEVQLLRDVLKVDNAGRVLTDDLARASRTATTDAKVLTDTYNALLNAGELADDCALTAFGGVAFDGPRGGMLGTILSWSISL